MAKRKVSSPYASVSGWLVRVRKGVWACMHACAEKNSVLFYVETCQNLLRRRRSLCVHYVYNYFGRRTPRTNRIFNTPVHFIGPVCVGAPSHCTHTSDLPSSRVEIELRKHGGEKSTSSTPAEMRAVPPTDVNLFCKKAVFAS